jgi:hypothetical protein
MRSSSACSYVITSHVVTSGPRFGGHGRYCQDVDGVSLDKGQAVLALLGLSGDRAGPPWPSPLRSCSTESSYTKRAK